MCTWAAGDRSGQAGLAAEVRDGKTDAAAASAHSGKYIRVVDDGCVAIWVLVAGVSPEGEEDQQGR
jgi:hypothetical protein